MAFQLNPSCTVKLREIIVECKKQGLVFSVEQVLTMAITDGLDLFQRDLERINRLNLNCAPEFTILEFNNEDEEAFTNEKS